jgi:hypothetical protein
MARKDEMLATLRALMSRLHRLRVRMSRRLLGRREARIGIARKVGR